MVGVCTWTYTGSTVAAADKLKALFFNLPIILSLNIKSNKIYYDIQGKKISSLEQQSRKLVLPFN